LPYEITIKKRANKILNKFDRLNHEAAVIISDHIKKLSIDPYTPRPMMDISPIAGSNPHKYRIRIGAQTRIEYTVDDLTHIVDAEEIITKRRNRLCTSLTEIF
jgi:mRNA-degrading endonuclease RelE of RelBE toxin-antitoxin system